LQLRVSKSDRSPRRQKGWSDSASPSAPRRDGARQLHVQHPFDRMAGREAPPDTAIGARFQIITWLRTRDFKVDRAVADRGQIGAGRKGMRAGARAAECL